MPSRMAAKKETPRAPGKGNGDGKPRADPKAAAETGAPAEDAGPGGRTPAQLDVLGQYIKDLSFESPGAPQALQTPPQNPHLQIGVNVGAAPHSDEAYEVTINLEAHAKSDAGVIYNVELAYGGLFRLRNVPQNMLQPVLLIDCPTLLFPFLRRVLADVTRDGGFPPLMLDPIDFRRLYAQNLARTQEQAKN
jgi:preprotein translocase subunit SecB